MAKKKKTSKTKPKGYQSGRVCMTSVVDKLVKTSEKLTYPHFGEKRCHAGPPSRATCIQLLEDLRSVLFPGYFGPSDFSEQGMRFHVGAVLDSVAIRLREQILRGFCFGCAGENAILMCGEKAEFLTQEFVGRLPEVMELLMEDVQGHYEGDPAAHSPGEAIFCYPGVYTITTHRIAHELFKMGVPLIPRIMSEHAHSVTGIDIHPGATIGHKFFIDHGTGIVVGETTRIGERVRIYQGVTLGAQSFPLDKHGKPIKGIDRHPIIEDDVVIYAGATILGRVRIGKGTTIGGNVWITKDVPAKSVVLQSKDANALPKKYGLLFGGPAR